MVDLDELVPVVVPGLLDQPLDGPPERVEGGRGSSAWRVVASGRALLVKVAHAGAAVDKAIGVSRALRLAATTQAPVPREVFFDPGCRALLGRAVRIQTWLDGEVPGRLEPDDVPAFFAGLGTAVAALHEGRCEAFSPRVGGGPRSSTWEHFVRTRASLVRGRALRGGAFAAEELDPVLARAVSAAAAVSPLVQPRLVHRDLHLGNVLVSGAGTVVGLVDLDGAGAWDPAVDFVKLRAQVFPRFPGAEEAFRRGYASAAGALPEELDRRIFVTEVLELPNAVANAALHHNDFMVAVNRRRLAEVLRSPW